MKTGEGPTLPGGPQRRNGVIPFQMASGAASVAPLNTPAPPQEKQRRNGVIPFQMVSGAASVAPLNTPAPPQEKKRLGGPFPFPSGPSSSTTTDNQGPPHRNTPLVGPDTAQPPSFGSSNIRSQRSDGPRRSETGPSEAVASSNVAANSGQQFQQAQRQINALNDKLADAEATIARQEIEKADSKPKKPWVCVGFIDHQPSERFRDRQNPEVQRAIAELSAKLDVLEARYEAARTALKEAEGDAAALSAWRAKYGCDDAAWQALSDLVDEIDDDNLCSRHTQGERKTRELMNQEEKMLGMEFLRRRQKQAHRATPPTKVTTQSTPRGSQPIKRLKPAIEVKTHSLVPTKATGPTASSPPPPSQPQAGQDNGEGPGSGGSEPNEAASNGELNPPHNDSNGAMIPAPDTASASSNATALASQESLEAGSPTDGVASISGALQQTLIITQSVPQQVEENDMMVSNPANNQIAEFSQPQDGSQSGEDLTLRDSMEWMEIKEYLLIPWTPINGPAFTEQDPQAAMSAPAVQQPAQALVEYVNPPSEMSAPAVQQPAQALVEYEYPWPTFPQAEKRLGPVEWIRWTVRKKQVSKEMVVTAGSELLARIDEIQPVPPTGCKRQATEEMVRKAGSLLLARIDAIESIPAQPVQSVHPQLVLTQPVSQVHTESVQTEEASTQEVVSQSAVPQPTPAIPEPSAQVPLEAAMTVPAVSQPVLTAEVHIETVPTEVPTQATMSEPADSQPTQTVLEDKEKVAAEAVVCEPAVSQQAPAASEPSTETVMSAVSQPTRVVMDGTEKVAIEAIVSDPAISQQAPAALKPSPSEDNDSAWSDEEWWPALERQAPSELDWDSPIPTMPGSYISDPLDEVVCAPAATELAPAKSTTTSPMSTEEGPRKLATSKPARKDSDSTWPIVHEQVHGSLRTGTSSHLDVLLSQREERTRTESVLMSSLEGLQVTAISRVSTSSQVASPQDASATGTARAGVSKGAKRVEDADSPAMLSDQQSAVEQREQLGGREAASGHQKPGAQPPAPPAVTVSDESDMQEGSALLKGLWTGVRRLTFGVFVLMILILCSFPLWAGHLGHLRYAMEGPEQFLSELREEHGYDVPFLERLIYVFLRCFAGDRTLFG
jgi:hypothetical protein